jgi:hypothetical protein
VPRQIYGVILGLILQIPLVITLFRTLPRPVAGAIAGLGFCGLGLWILILGLKDPKWRKGLAYWMNLPFLFIFSLPIWLMSLFGVGQNLVTFAMFSQSYFVIPHQVLHHYANYWYRALIVCALIDLARAWWRVRKAARN